MTNSKKVGRIVIFGNSVQSMINFRGSLIKHLSATGADVFAMAPGYDEASEATIRDLGGIPIELPMSRSGTNPFVEVRLCYKLFKTLRSLRPDALISYFIKPSIYGSIIGWLVKIPVRIALIEGLGYSFQGSSDESYRRKLLRSTVTLMFRFALAKASKVVVLNEEDRQEFIKLRIGPASEIENIGGIGVDLGDFSYQPVPSGPMMFLCAARLIREKGIVDFADAARIVRLLKPDIQFVLLGGLDKNPGSLPAETIEQWVREGILAWPGNVVDVRPWLAKCSVFVLPSYYREGVPRSIQEAMAIGRAIITTDNVGCRDTVDPGINGLVVTPRDPQLLANAILELADEKIRVSNMGKESRAIAEARYDAKKFNFRMTQLAFVRAKNEKTEENNF